MTWQTDTVSLHRCRCKVCGQTFSSIDADRLWDWMSRHESLHEEGRA